MEAPQFQCSDNVNDVPVVQVVACCQRQGFTQWRCLRLSSSPELVDIPVRTETGGFQRGFGGDVGLGIFRATPGRP